MSGYGASLSRCDCTLLQAIRALETHSNLGDLLFLWGPDATERRRSCMLQSIDAGMSHLAAASLAQVTATRAVPTLAWFPSRRPLRGSFAIEARVVTAMAAEGVAPSTVYDPAFMLSLLAAWLRQECRADLRLIVERDILSLAVTALTSLDAEMRTLGGVILSRVVDILPRAACKERRELLLVLVTLRDAIVDPTARLLGVVAAFVCRALRLMLHPDHVPMYPLIARFLLSRPTIDLSDVPLLYSLLHSGSQHHRVERAWILRLLANGLRERDDYANYKRRHVAELLLTLMGSPLTDVHAARLALRVIVRACAQPSVATTLLTRHGLCAWLVRSLDQRPDALPLPDVVELVCNLFHSLAEPGPVAEETSEEAEQASKAAPSAGAMKASLPLLTRRLLFGLVTSASSLPPALLVALISSLTHAPDGTLDSRHYAMLLLLWARLAGTTQNIFASFLSTQLDLPRPVAATATTTTTTATTTATAATAATTLVVSMSAHARSLPLSSSSHQSAADTPILTAHMISIFLRTAPDASASCIAAARWVLLRVAAVGRSGSSTLVLEWMQRALQDPLFTLMALQQDLVPALLAVAPVLAASPLLSDSETNTASTAVAGAAAAPCNSLAALVNCLARVWHTAQTLPPWREHAAAWAPLIDASLPPTPDEVGDAPHADHGARTLRNVRRALRGLAPVSSSEALSSIARQSRAASEAATPGSNSSKRRRAR